MLHSLTSSRIWRAFLTGIPSYFLGTSSLTLGKPRRTDCTICTKEIYPVTIFENAGLLLGQGSLSCSRSFKSCFKATFPAVRHYRIHFHFLFFSAAVNDSSKLGSLPGDMRRYFLTFCRKCLLSSVTEKHTHTCRHTWSRSDVAPVQ